MIVLLFVQLLMLTVGARGMVHTTVLGIIYGVAYLALLIVVRISPVDHPGVALVHLLFKMAFSGYIAGWMLSEKFVFMTYLLNILLVKVFYFIWRLTNRDSPILAEVLTVLGVIIYSSTLFLMLLTQNPWDILIVPLFTLSYSLNLRKTLIKHDITTRWISAA